MKRVFKITGLIFLSLAMLLFLALLFLPYIVDLNNYREAAARESGRALNRKVSIGDIRLTTLTGFGIRLKDIKVDEDLLEVGSLKLRLSLLPLLKGRIEFSRIIIDKPSLLLKRDREGNWNASQAAEGDKLKTKKPSEPEGKDDISFKILTALLVSDLEIKNGKVRLQDVSSKKPV
ncbi:MAG: AsmA family protein, partial [Nitrospirae bacterium]|nr:AsmA family protein [Nitrospirota bacterium]